jgi:iron-sulfur cluster repair protein YtfE (RIC family)
LQRDELSEEEERYLRVLIAKLLQEHHNFSSNIENLNQSINDSRLAFVSEIFSPLQEALVEHMLIEESEIFPEISRRGLFDDRISEIMQQHLDITSALGNMKSALHGKNFQALRRAFDELSGVIRVHFPAEEKEAFLLLA